MMIYSFRVAASAALGWINNTHMERVRTFADGEAMMAEARARGKVFIFQHLPSEVVYSQA